MVLDMGWIGIEDFMEDMLGGGCKHFYCHPYLGKISHLTNIFQMGWNHQPAC